MQNLTVGTGSFMTVGTGYTINNTLFFFSQLIFFFYLFLHLLYKFLMASKNSKSTNSPSVNNVPKGSNAPFVVGTLSHSRNMDVWCNWDLVEMSDGSQKAQCKHCGSLLNKDSKV